MSSVAARTVLIGGLVALFLALGFGRPGSTIERAPVVEVGSDSNTVPGRLIRSRWSGPDPVPPDRARPLPVVAGDSVQFTLPDFPGWPLRRATIALYAAEDSGSAGDDRGVAGTAHPLGTWDISPGQVRRDRSYPARLTWTWRVPDDTAPASPEGTNHYLVRVRAVWGALHWTESEVELAVSHPWSRGGDFASALDVARSFLEATLAGDRETVEALSAPGTLGPKAEGLPATRFSFLRVDNTSSWQLILWKDEGRRFEVAARPFLASWEGAGDPGFVASATFDYTVLVYEGGSARPVPYSFSESHNLTWQEGVWKVAWFSRSGLPAEAKGGTATGWKTSLKADGAGTITCGPFTGNRGLAWTRDGKRLAFLGGNYNLRELWQINPEAGSGKLLADFDLPPGAHGEPILLGWSADGGSILLLVSGERTLSTGPPQPGWWVRSYSPKGGESADIAFVPGPAKDSSIECQLTADGSALVVTRPAVALVDLAEGWVTCLDWLPSGVGLSPDGWAAAYDSGSSRQAYVIADLARATQVTVQPGPEVGWTGFKGWSPDGLVIIEEARAEEVTRYSSPWRVPPILALSLCDRAGRLQHRIEAPAADLRIGAFAFAPDGTAVAFACGPVDTVETGGYEGPTKAVRATQLRVWDKIGGSSPPLADLPGSPVSLAWPAQSTLRLYQKESGRMIPHDYDIDCVDGTWRLTPRLWDGGAPESIVGAYGPALLTCRRLEPGDYPRTRLALEGAGSVGTLAEVFLNPYSSDLSIGSGYVAVYDNRDGGMRGFLMVVGLPGS